MASFPLKDKNIPELKGRPAVRGVAVAPITPPFPRVEIVERENIRVQLRVNKDIY